MVDWQPTYRCSIALPVSPDGRGQLSCSAVFAFSVERIIEPPKSVNENKRRAAMVPEVTWVLDWNRIANLLVVLTPFFIAIGTGVWAAFKYFDGRQEKRRNEEVAHRKEMEAKERERRQGELEELREERTQFQSEIVQEARRMRELYESELDRGVSLRVALAEAAQREMELAGQIVELNKKIENLQNEVAELRKEAKAARTKAA